MGTGKGRGGAGVEPEWGRRLECRFGRGAVIKKELIMPFDS